jgi:hypothetical protein
MPPPPLRLLPRPDDHAAAEAALLEAVVTGLPPGGRVLIAGDADGTAAWLADALDAVEVEAVVSPLPARDTRDEGGLFGDTPFRTRTGDYDAVVVDAQSLGTGAVPALATLTRSLAPGGRLLVQAPPAGARSLGAWVRLLGAAGLVLRDVRDAAHGGLAGSVFVAEEEPGL